MISTQYDQINSSKDSGINRLLCAAVVSRQFCNLLLANPVLAVETGYAGERFPLSHHELRCLSYVQASTLTDFVDQLFQQMALVELEMPMPRKYVSVENEKQ